MSTKLIPVQTPAELDAFYRLGQEVYADYPLYRCGYGDILPLLVEGRSPFCEHADVTPYLIMRSGHPAGRFAFVHDRNLPDYAQIAFFEALPDIENLAELILKTAKQHYPLCSRLVVGLNGHVNYGAGFLLSRFDEVPIFELPYTPAYYRDYFADLTERQMHTFRYPMQEFYAWGERMRDRANLKGITVRGLDPKHFERDIGVYTELNNACFTEHPYWSNRSLAEDLELFRPLEAFLHKDNLLFAEYQGKAVGFLFWLPDLNELLDGQETPGEKQLEKYQSGFKFEQYRFHEIAVVPGFRGPATLALFLAMLVSVKKMGCVYGEGGIIFADNLASINMTKRYYQRVFGCLPEPWRRLAVYEAKL
ncbi:MAG: hypothetical protein LHW56_02010 [Candidatus Cloacimonetes bacterium]|jgi:hypothetical protein|nr:hypothetical protein [Candidatus Cloacimonadota bacterium]MDY0171661.1 hypothetical protein [Candidatus Cloacimonadaceae bacterium]